MHSSSLRSVPKRDGLMLSQRGSSGRLADVGPRVDRRVEAQPLLGPGERLAAAVLEPRVLDHDVRERTRRRCGRARGRARDRRTCRGSTPSGRATRTRSVAASRSISARSQSFVDVELELERPGSARGTARSPRASTRRSAPGRYGRPSDVGERAPRPAAARGRARRSRTPSAGSRVDASICGSAGQSVELVQPDASTRRASTCRRASRRREVVVVGRGVGDVLAVARSRRRRRARRSSSRA